MSKQPVRLGIISNTITPKLRELISKSDEHAQHIMVSMGVALQSWIVQSFTDKAKRIEPWKPKANISQLISYQWEFKDFFRTQFYFINRIENILNL